LERATEVTVLVPLGRNKLKNLQLLVVVVSVPYFSYCIFSTVLTETLEEMPMQIPYTCPCSGTVGKNAEQDSS